MSGAIRFVGRYALSRHEADNARERTTIKRRVDYSRGTARSNPAGCTVIGAVRREYEYAVAARDRMRHIVQAGYSVWL